MFTALHTWSFRERFKNTPGFKLEQAIDQAAAWGFHGLEVMAGKAGSPRPDDLESDDPAYLRRIVARARQAGVPLLSYSTYNDFAFVKNEEWRLANIAYIKKWLQLAGDTGVPNIRLLTGYLDQETPPARLEELTRNAIKECVPYAEKAGVNMALENHSSVFMSAEAILQLIQDVGSPRLTTCPDPSNWTDKSFFTAAGSPAARELVFKSAAALIPRATQSHLKIAGLRDGKLLGWDDDLERLIRSYHQAGYQGAIAFESIAEGDLLAPLAEAQRIVSATITHVTGQK